MSMIPFFPSLRPPIRNRLWFDVHAPVNEEAEILRYEREHHVWMDSMKTIAADLNPLGKVLIMAGPEETDDEDANDDSDDTETHDDDDEDTNDRNIASQPERAALGLYSPGEDMSVSDDVLNVAGPLQ